jgi:hypothetical protein
MGLLNRDELAAKCQKFANGRAGALRLSATMDPFVEGWFPTVSGERVNCGDANPTPSSGFQTRAEAIDCARTYKQLCRDWLAKNTLPHSEGVM